uniref:Uncharacterized protein n=1 Tax=Anopheles atroparvus TaxID=41427 RepID=A0A182JIN5_ANOAO
MQEPTEGGGHPAASGFLSPGSRTPTLLASMHRRASGVGYRPLSVPSVDRMRVRRVDGCTSDRDDCFLALRQTDYGQLFRILNRQLLQPPLTPCSPHCWWKLVLPPACDRAGPRSESQPLVSVRSAGASELAFESAGRSTAVGGGGTPSTGTAGPTVGGGGGGPADTACGTPTPAGAYPVGNPAYALAGYWPGLTPGGATWAPVAGGGGPSAGTNPDTTPVGPVGPVCGPFGGPPADCGGGNHYAILDHRHEPHPDRRCDSALNHHRQQRHRNPNDPTPMVDPHPAHALARGPDPVRRLPLRPSLPSEHAPSGPSNALPPSAVHPTTSQHEVHRGPDPCPTMHVARFGPRAYRRFRRAFGGPSSLRMSYPYADTSSARDFGACSLSSNRSCVHRSAEACHFFIPFTPPPLPFSEPRRSPPYPPSAPASRPASRPAPPLPAPPPPPPPPPPPCESPPRPSPRSSSRFERIADVSSPSNPAPSRSSSAVRSSCS